VEIIHYLMLLSSFAVFGIGMLFYSIELKIRGGIFMVVGIVASMISGNIIFSAGIAAGLLM